MVNDLFLTYSSYCRNNSICLGEELHMPSCFCALGASGWEAKDEPGGGPDERPTCSHGERTGEHAGQSAGQLPGAPDHADKGEGFNFFHYPYSYYTILDNTLSHQYCGKQSEVWKMWEETQTRHSFLLHGDWILLFMCSSSRWGSSWKARSLACSRRTASWGTQSALPPTRWRASQCYSTILVMLSRASYMSHLLSLVKHS